MISAVVDEFLRGVGVGDEEAEFIQGAKLHETGRFDLGTVHEDDGIFRLFDQQAFDTQLVGGAGGDDAVGCDAGKSQEGGFEKHIAQQVYGVRAGDGAGGLADGSGQTENVNVWKFTEGKRGF